MGRVIPKQPHTMFVGNGPTIQTLYELTARVLRDNAVIVPYESTRFLTQTTASVDGQKITFKRAVIERRTEPKKLFFGHEAQPSKTSSTNSIIVIGAENRGISAAYDGLTKEKKVQLITSRNEILSKYDFLVQDVVRRYLRKAGIKISTATTVLSAKELKDKIGIVAEQKGLVKRFAADNFITTSSEVWAKCDDLGLTNLAPQKVIDSSSKTVLPFLLAPACLSIDSEHTLTLDEMKPIIDWTTSKTIKWRQDDTVLSCVTIGPNLIFSIGIREQDYIDTHLYYKRKVTKLGNPQPLHPTYFIKALSSRSNKIIGLSGVLPADLFNIQDLIHVVRERSSLHILGHQIDSSSEYSQALFDLLYGDHS